jgi:hypothetical protein
MPVIMPCDKCRRRLRVLDRLLGKMVRCPACRHKFRAPELEDAAPLGTSAAAPPVSAPAASPARAHGARLAPRPVHAIEAGPPPEDIALEPADDGLAPAALAPAEDLEETPPRAETRTARPRQSSFLSVFITLGGILLLTAVLGVLSAYWVNAGVQSLQGRPSPARR